MFNIGDIVFAKLKGYSFWPAEIVDIIKIKEGKPPHYNVLFFGDNTTGKIKDTDLCLYSENKAMYGKHKTDNFKNKTFNQALAQAEAAFHKKTQKYDTCYSNENSRNVTNNQMESDNASSKDLNIEDIQDIVKNYSKDENDLETSLNLAAEVGNALLAENSNLKHDLHNLALENGRLALQITEKTLYEEKIDELTYQNEQMLTRNNLLIETINNLEKQVENEKLLRRKLEETFEEADREKEQTLRMYEYEIQRLKQNIEAMGKTLSVTDEVKEEEIAVKQKNIEVQTDHLDNLDATHSSFLLTEISKIKVQQEKMESLIQTIENKINKESILTQNPLPLEASKTTSTPLPTKNNRSQYHRRKSNVFSVSLQNAKYKEQVTCTTDCFEGANNRNTTERARQTLTEKLQTEPVTERDRQTLTKTLPIEPTTRTKTNKLRTKN